MTPTTLPAGYSLAAKSGSFTAHGSLRARLTEIMGCYVLWGNNLPEGSCVWFYFQDDQHPGTYTVYWTAEYVTSGTAQGDSWLLVSLHPVEVAGAIVPDYTDVDYDLVGGGPGIEVVRTGTVPNLTYEIGIAGLPLPFNVTVSSDSSGTRFSVSTWIAP